MLRACFISAFLFVAACSDGGGGVSQPPNMPPMADAGADQTVIEGAAVTLDGSGDDGDGTIVSFSWVQTGGPAVSLNNSSAQTAGFAAPLVDMSTTFTFTLTVRDDDGAERSSDVQIVVLPAPRGEVVEIETVFDGKPRAYSVYTPVSYVAGNRAVLLLHGGGGSMREVLLTGRTTNGWLDLADANGFLLIVPNGFSESDDDGLGDQQSWNDIRDDQTGRTSLEDDVGFLLNVLDDVEAARGFDRQRLFSTGSSNGGIMTMTLLIEQPDLFFGGAAFIASLPEEAVPVPASPTPIMMLNGTLDALILFDGGPVSTDGAPTRSVLDSVDYFVHLTGGDRPGAVTTQLADIDPGDGCEIFETVYLTTGGTPAVTYYEARGGGHNIPDPDAAPFSAAAEPILGPRCRDVNGVDLAFAFFDAL